MITAATTTVAATLKAAETKATLPPLSQTYLKSSRGIGREYRPHRLVGATARVAEAPRPAGAIKALGDVDADGTPRSTFVSVALAQAFIRILPGTCPTVEPYDLGHFPWVP